MIRRLLAVLTALLLSSHSLAFAETVGTPTEIHLLKRDGTGLLITGGAALQVGALVILTGYLIQSLSGLGSAVGNGINVAFGGEPAPPPPPDHTGRDVMIAGGIVGGIGIALVAVGAVKLHLGRTMVVVAPRADGAVAALAFEL